MYQNLTAVINFIIRLIEMFWTSFLSVSGMIGLYVISMPIIRKIVSLFKKTY